MYQKILVGLDGSKSSWRAFAKALEIARHMGAELHALTVEESQARRPEAVKPGAPDDPAVAEMTLSGAILMEARQRGIEVGVEVHTRSVEGHEIRTLLAFAEKGKFDLLVVGRTGHSKVFQDQAGSTATMLMLRSPCAFLAVP